MTLGEKIRSARKYNGITQKQLADLINVKHNSISDWESDKHKPDVDSLEKICDILDLNPSDLLGQKNVIDNGTIVGKIMADQDAIDMMEKFYSLDKEGQTIIRRFIDMFYDSRC